MPAARTAVKGALFLRVRRSEAQTLDGRRSEGHARSASLSRFSLGTLFSTRLMSRRSRALSGIPTYTREPRSKYQAIDFACVDVCKLEVHLRALCSYPAGDDVSTFIRCERSVHDAASPRLIRKSHYSVGPQLAEQQRLIHELGAQARGPRTAAWLRCPMQTRVGRANAWRSGHATAAAQGSEEPCTPVHR